MEVEQKTNELAQKRLDWDCWNTLDDITTQQWKWKKTSELVKQRLDWDCWYILDDITTQQWKWNRKPMDLLKKD